MRDVIQICVIVLLLIVHHIWAYKLGYDDGYNKRCDDSALGQLRRRMEHRYFMVGCIDEKDMTEYEKGLFDAYGETLEIIYEYIKEKSEVSE